MANILAINDLWHNYGARVALRGLTLTLPDPCFFGLLGPNGSGKTTLFKLLATLVKPQRGSVRLLDQELAAAPMALRAQLGVVFQHPSLDPHLTVAENLRHHGMLYGLHGAALRARVTELLTQLSLQDRAADTVKSLSGGLQRRVELARCLLHRPRVLLLDEPTTGLDPTARLEFWQLLRGIRQDQGISVLFTTHWFEEAERSELLGILHQGQLVALDTPAAHKARIQGEVVKLFTSQPDVVLAKLRQWPNLQITRFDRVIMVENHEGPALVARLLETLQGEVDELSVARPTLEDVFVRCTGVRFTDVPEVAP